MSRSLSQAWELLSNDQRIAAEVLRERTLHRACVGRAYYAAYSRVTAALVAGGRRDFGRFKNPDHASLPALVLNGLGSLPVAERRSLAAALRRLRSRREDADYRPETTIADQASRESMSDLASVRGTFERRHR